MSYGTLWLVYVAFFTGKHYLLSLFCFVLLTASLQNYALIPYFVDQLCKIEIHFTKLSVLKKCQNIA